MAHLRARVAQAGAAPSGGREWAHLRARVAQAVPPPPSKPEPSNPVNQTVNRVIDSTNQRAIEKPAKPSPAPEKA